jgi:hypothetical protein
MIISLPLHIFSISAIAMSRESTSTIRPWAEEEIAMLYIAVCTYGDSWAKVSAKLPGRTKAETDTALQSRE